MKVHIKMLSCLTFALIISGCSYWPIDFFSGARHRVIYNAGGANCGPTPIDWKTYAEGDMVVVLPADEGTSHTAMELDVIWYTEENGGGEGYPGGSTFIMGRKDVRLSSWWAKFFEYHDSDATSGEPPFRGYYPRYSTQTVLGNAGGLAREGYAFAAWSASYPGYGYNDIFAEGDTFYIDRDWLSDFFPVWIPSIYAFTSSDHQITITGYSGSINGPLTFPNGTTGIGDSAFSGRNDITSVDFGSYISKLGSNAFASCDGLVEAALGPGMKSIGDGAFRGCQDLSSVTIRATLPPTLHAGSGAFDGVSSQFLIHVNASTDDGILNAYVNADGWKEYADSIVAP